MPVYSLVDGINAEYAIAAGKPIIKLKAEHGIRYRAAYTGTALLYFHWVTQGKSSYWKFDPSIQDPKPIQFEETKANDGSQLLTFTLGELVPATGLLRVRWEGTMIASAIHIDVSMGKDIWIFILRSPWFPLKLSLPKQTLNVTADSVVATATVTPGSAGGFSVTISNPAGPFKKTSLIMKRKIGQYVSEELITEVEQEEAASNVWNPVMRSFELCLITKSSMEEGQLQQIAKGLGAESSSSILGSWILRKEYFLCDGPLTEYSLVLRGDRGLFRHEEDSAPVQLSW